MSKILKRKCQKGGWSNIKRGSDPLAQYGCAMRSSLKELRSCVLCIISVWSLFCLMRLNSGLHFLLIALEEWLFMFPCLNLDHYYDRLYWGHMFSLYKIQKQLFKQVPWNTSFWEVAKIFQRTTAQVSFKYFVHWLLIISCDFLEFLKLLC